MIHVHLVAVFEKYGFLARSGLRPATRIIIRMFGGSSVESLMTFALKIRAETSRRLDLLQVAVHRQTDFMLH